MQPKKKKGRRYEEFDLSSIPIVRIVQYTDPDRKVMAEVCRIYMGMKDLDTQRPLRLLMQEHDSFLESLDIQVSVISSVACRDQAFRNKLARAMASRGFRANVASQIVPPHEIWNDEAKMEVFKLMAEHHLETIDDLLHIGFKPQEARALLGLGAVCEWTYRVNARLLAHSIFRDRLWVSGYQHEIGIMAKRMWELIREHDKELWDTIEWIYGYETQQWRRIGRALRKLRQDTPIQKYKQERGEETKPFTEKMWNGHIITSLTAQDFWHYVQQQGNENLNLFDAVVRVFSEERSMWDK